MELIYHQFAVIKTKITNYNLHNIFIMTLFLEHFENVFAQPNFLFILKRFRLILIKINVI